MKKKVLSLLLVIAMLLPIFNVTVFAANEPTITSHKNGKSYTADDFYIKWKSVAGAKRYRLAVKSLNDGSYAADIWWDDKLTKTKYECDEDDIKPGHRYKIWVGACGSSHDDVISQYSVEVTAKAAVCDHDDYEDCYDYSKYEQISGDNTYHNAVHYYERVCEDCDETIKSNVKGNIEKEKHNFSGDKCKACGYKKTCSHSDYEDYYDYTKYEQISNDNDYHNAVSYYERVCDDCDKTIKSDVKGDIKKEAHSFSGNKCTKCYYTKEDDVCKHSKTTTKAVDYEYDEYNEEKHYVTTYHDKICSDCKVTVESGIKGSTIKENHSFSGNKCTKCYYTKEDDVCKHSKTTTKAVDYEYDEYNEQKHYVTTYHDKICSDCKVTVESGIKGSTIKENHSFSGNKCTKCYYTKEDDVCKHSKTTTKAVDYEYDEYNEQKHYVTAYQDKICSDCKTTVQSGIKGSMIKENHSFSGNKCTKCFYTKVEEKTEKAQQLATPKVTANKTTVSTGEKITLSWKKVTNADYYTVKVWVTGESEDVTGTSYNNISFDEAGTYAISVYARSKNNKVYLQSDAGGLNVTVKETEKVDTTKPVIGDISSSAGSTFKKGTSTKITVTVTDENLSETVLYVDNKKIKNFTSDKISSTLPSLAIGTHTITIKAKDKAGNSAEKSITLTVTEPQAVIPTVEVLSATNITATSATLQGKVTSNGGVKIKKYGFTYDDGTNTQYKLIDGHVDNNKVFTVNITGLKPETAYSYQVIAVNENNIEGKSYKMKFITLEGVAEPEKEADTFVNNNVLILGVNEYEGYHNGLKIKVENSKHTPVPPYISGNRTLIPLRFIAESLGAKKELYGSVNWDEKTKTITICYRNTTAIYKIGSKQFTVKGTIYEDVYTKKIVYSEEGMTFTDFVAPKIDNGNTYIPLRLMCEKVFGMKVEYIENGSVIVIFPRENYVFEKESYYSGLIEKVRHTHKYSSNGDGKHSCSICGKIQTCSGNPCGVCGYKQPENNNVVNNNRNISLTSSWSYFYEKEKSIYLYTNDYLQISINNNGKITNVASDNSFSWKVSGNNITLDNYGTICGTTSGESTVELYHNGSLVDSLNIVVFDKSKRVALVSSLPEYVHVFNVNSSFGDAFDDYGLTLHNMSYKKNGNNYSFYGDAYNHTPATMLICSYDHNGVLSDKDYISPYWDDLSFFADIKKDTVDTIYDMINGKYSNGISTTESTKTPISLNVPIGGYITVVYDSQEGIIMAMADMLLALASIAIDVEFPENKNPLVQYVGDYLVQTGTDVLTSDSSELYQVVVDIFNNSDKSKLASLLTASAIDAGLSNVENKLLNFVPPAKAIWEGVDTFGNGVKMKCISTCLTAFTDKNWVNNHRYTIRFPSK